SEVGERPFKFFYPVRRKSSFVLDPHQFSVLAAERDETVTQPRFVAKGIIIDDEAERAVSLDVFIHVGDIGEGDDVIELGSEHGGLPEMLRANTVVLHQDKP